MMHKGEMLGNRRPSDTRRSAERAYGMIRESVLSGVSPPGTHLAEETLAEMTGLSRTPVREALQRLASEGLVTNEPNGRCYVASFDTTEIQSIFEIRARLESYAAQLAAERRNAADLESLRAINDRIEALGHIVSNEALVAFVDLNTQFHRLILDMSGSRNLRIAATAAVAVPLVLLKHFVWHEPVNVALSNAQHREIIAALEAGNGPWAAACMANHINSTRPIEGRPSEPLDQAIA